MDELIKQRLMFALIAANLAIVFIQIVFNSGLFGYEFAAWRLGLAIGIGLAIGAVTFFGAKFLQG